MRARRTSGQLGQGASDGWAPASGEILSVSDLLIYARDMMETGLGDVWVEGEILDLRKPASGHAYFILADEDCRMRAVCFRSVQRLLEHPLRQNDKVLVRGRLTVYEARGDLQMVVEHLAPQGEGLEKLRFEALKKKLAAEGLFAPERKRALEELPRAVGVVTSETGAAVQDILQVLGRRAPWLDVYISPATVQGKGAAGELIRALDRLEGIEEVDAVIIGRGGGESRDLSAFNDEALVRRIAEMTKPVISAVGHEIDYTLTDLVADMRAPTPSAAAELAVSDAGQLVERLDKLKRELTTGAELAIGRCQNRLHRLDVTRHDPLRGIEVSRVRLDRAIEAVEDSCGQALRHAGDRLARAASAFDRLDPLHRIEVARFKLATLLGGIEGGVARQLGEASRRFELAGAGLGKLSPRAVLGRGYAIVRDAEGAVVRDASTRSPGDRLDVTVARGALECEVKEVKKGREAG
jgi:exodeoxyribonuclease VII large subunit